MTETAKELLRKTKVIRDNFYPEPIELEHEDEQKITFKFLSEVINYLENDTDKLSVEKLEPIGYYNEAHGFLHDEFDKDCYCQGGCSMEAVYTGNQIEKLQEELESCIQTFIEASVAATITQDIVVGNLVNRKLADLAKTHKLAVDYIEKVTGKNIDVILSENAALGNEGSGDE